ncbi:MAG TPA: hypothetical protein PLX96_05880, partial [Candidatus Omnitrophota bacterium]|nr:hypothetical protein [Candidatus Omnitrophota bacterium]
MLSPNLSVNFRRLAPAIFLSAVMILVGLSGCVAQGASGGAGAPKESEYALGKKLVQEVFSVYRNYSRDSFDAIVSRDFNPIRSEYVNAVERGFYGAQQLDLYPIVDSVVTNRDLMSVSFRWEKKVVSYSSGNHQNLTGRAEYV